MTPATVCPRCGTDLYGNVRVNNLFAELGSNIINNIITYKPQRLYANDVVIEFVNFFCLNCRKEVPAEQVVYRCDFCSVTGPIEEFVILRFMKPNGTSYNKPMVCHQSTEQKVINDMNNQGFVLKSSSPVTTTIRGIVEGA